MFSRLSHEWMPHFADNYTNLLRRNLCGSVREGIMLQPWFKKILNLLNPYLYFSLIVLETNHVSATAWKGDLSIGGRARQNRWNGGKVDFDRIFVNVTYLRRKQYLLCTQRGFKIHRKHPEGTQSISSLSRFAATANRWEGRISSFNPLRITVLV